jgi:hypothetical protein
MSHLLPILAALPAILANGEIAGIIFVIIWVVVAIISAAQKNKQKQQQRPLPPAPPQPPVPASRDWAPPKQSGARPRLPATLKRGPAMRPSPPRVNPARLPQMQARRGPVAKAPPVVKAPPVIKAQPVAKAAPPRPAAVPLRATQAAGEGRMVLQSLQPMGPSAMKRVLRHSVAREGFVLSEILRPPLALREDERAC